MPKVTMLFDVAGLGGGDFASNFDFKKFGQAIRELVAEAASTDGAAFAAEDVDFIPLPYPPGTLVHNPISIEIETIGYPYRKLKLSPEVIGNLKQEIAFLILADDHGMPVSIMRPLVWLKFQDPDGCHI